LTGDVAIENSLRWGFTGAGGRHVMNELLEKVSITGWKRLLYGGIFLLLLWQLSRFWGQWEEGVTSIFYCIHGPMHEVGHTVAGMLHLPETAVILAGTVFQVLTPVAAGIYLACKGDLSAISFCTGWLGFSVMEAGIYMYDAAIGQLTLVVPFMDASDCEGDFTLLFRQWGCLDSGCAIGRGFVYAGYSIVFISLAMIIAMFISGFLKKQVPPGEKS
jgi:hypothetical protein